MSVLKDTTTRTQSETELGIVFDALKSAMVGVIIANLEGRINFVNPAFLNIFKYKDQNEVIGKNAAEPRAAFIAATRETQDTVGRSLDQCADELFALGELHLRLSPFGDVTAHDDHTEALALASGQRLHTEFVNPIRIVHAKGLRQVEFPGLVQHAARLFEIFPEVLADQFTDLIEEMYA